MTTTIPKLLIVATVAFAPQSAAQQARQLREPVASSRVPVDVSLQGVGTIPASRSGGVGLGLECLQRIADQATEGCLQASSMPTFGLLYPYPGIHNVSSGTYSFVGGGENNQATGKSSTVGGGYNNTASGYHATVGGGGGSMGFYYG